MPHAYDDYFLLDFPANAIEINKRECIASGTLPGSQVADSAEEMKSMP